VRRGGLTSGTRLFQLRRHQSTVKRPPGRGEPGAWGCCDGAAENQKKGETISGRKAVKFLVEALKGVLIPSYHPTVKGQRCRRTPQRKSPHVKTEESAKPCGRTVLTGKRSRSRGCLCVGRSIEQKRGPPSSRGVIARRSIRSGETTGPKPHGKGKNMGWTPLRRGKEDTWIVAPAREPNFTALTDYSSTRTSNGDAASKIETLAA